MSAVCGILNPDGRPVAPETMDRMMAAMDYWGPDGSGTWMGGPVALGHLALHSTPESVSEVLPRVSASGNLVITAHARIDNREELFRGLDIPVRERSAMPDSALILGAYEKWGQACPGRLTGDWAFAIWDKSARTLFVARDHCGNTGIYYCRTPRFFAFSSSIKGLLALPGVPRELDELRVAQILVSWPEHGEGTCYKGITRLPPAHQLAVTGGKVASKRYWFLEDTPPLKLGSDHEYVEAFMEVYTEAVRCRLRSLRPVGVTLSGGLDSGSVTALAARELGLAGKRLQAFSSAPLYDVAGLAPRGRFGDESPFVEATARQCGNVDVTYVRAEDVSPVKGVLKGLELHDEPGHAASNQYWILSLLGTAHDRGIGALLTGQEGNATVSWHAPGYLTNWVRKGRWAAVTHELAALKAVTGRPLWRLTAGRVIKPLVFDPLIGLRQRLKPAPEPWTLYSAINREFARELRIMERMREAGHDPFFRPVPDSRRRRFALIKPGRSIGGFLWQENGAGFGLDVRDPTADKRVMEFCLSIPDEQYARDGRDRWLIRRAMKGYMPERVLDEQRRGLQAADVGRRMLACMDEAADAFRRVEGSKLAARCLDLPLMRRTLDSARQRLDKRATRDLGTIFFRGLGVGLFLLSFDGKAPREAD